MQYHQISWYHNGSYIGVNTNDLRYNSSFLAEEHGEMKLKLKISNLSLLDIGDYTGIIKGYTYSMLSSRCYEYTNFIPFWWYFIFSEFPVSVMYFSINIYSRFTLVCLNKACI